VKSRLDTITGHAQTVELDGQITHPATRRAHEVMVFVFDVRIDPQ
jgi:hypothetical protein